MPCAHIQQHHTNRYCPRPWREGRERRNMVLYTCLLATVPICGHLPVVRIGKPRLRGYTNLAEVQSRQLLSSLLPGGGSREGGDLGNSGPSSHSRVEHPRWSRLPQPSAGPPPEQRLRQAGGGGEGLPGKSGAKWGWSHDLITWFQGAAGVPALLQTMGMWIWGALFPSLSDVSLATLLAYRVGALEK